jgi:hypothetical protein
LGLYLIGKGVLINKICASADMGVALEGYFPNGYGIYEVGVYNGEGYNKAPSANSSIVDVNPSYQLNARVIPIAGITVGGSFRMTNETIPEDTTTGRDEEKKAITNIAGLCRLAYGPVDLSAQYILNERKSTEVKSSCISITPIVNIAKRYQITGRYDIWDNNTDVDKEAKDYTLFVVGANWVLTTDSKGKPETMLQLNYESQKPQNEGAKATNSIALQLRWNLKATPSKKR